MSLTQKYGKLALVAGASEGIGAAFSHYLAASGMDLVLIARRSEPLEQIASLLANKHKVSVLTVCCDLSDANAAHHIKNAVQDREINMLVYNAALSYIGQFENNSLEHHNLIARANMITPMNLIQLLGPPMLKNGKGAVILMASLAGFQGSGFLAAYAATKAFNRVLAESLWYEWKNRGVDVIACCAGATATENFIRSNPEKTGFFAPRVQSPEEVVTECMRQLGKRPSVVTGRGNKLASFIMQNLLPRKTAVNLMGDNTRKLYRL